MPRATKKDKFYIYAPNREGGRLMGVNHSYEGGTDNLTLQDLLDFLKDQGVKPSSVRISFGFITYANG